MQISDMLKQYNHNLLNSSTEELKGASGRQKLVSTVKELQSGNIFEGTVSAVKGGRVTLALSNGQTITAQMDGKVNLSIGTPMFFQVKNNDGNTVSIRPYLIEGNAGNPILLNALTTAGIPVNERNLFMADIMMQEQLPIDKQSILDMAKLSNLNPEVSVKTVVEMAKLGIPVSKAMAVQYENYLGERHSILQEMNQVMKELAGCAGNQELPAAAAVRLNQEILDILLNQEEGLGSAQENWQEIAQKLQEQNTEELRQQGGLFTAGVLAAKEAEHTQGMVSAKQIQGEIFPVREPDANEIEQTFESMEQSEELQSAGETPIRTAGDGAAALAQILSEEGLQNLNKLLQNIPTLVDNPELFPEAEEVFVDTMQEEGGKLTPETAAEEEQKIPSLDADMTVEQFLKAVKRGLSVEQDFGFAGVQKLFASKEYQSLLKNIMEQEWLMKPQELRTDNKINELYEKLDRQLLQLETAMQRAGMTTEAFSQTAAGVHNNIEFMNLVNQAYTYVQLPLKLSNQNTNSELYVYTNKKNLNDPDAEVTAFLHLDMEHLGVTDVSVKLQNKHVKTNFYFSDDTSYELIKQYLPVLEQALAKKGYTCSLSVNQDEKEINFVKDFLRKDQPQAGTLHRYSFDVKA